MRILKLSPDRSRHAQLAELVSGVVCSAPLSPEVGRPLAQVSLSPIERGFKLHIKTLSQDSSCEVHIPSQDKAVAVDCQTYVANRLAASGILAA